MNIEVLRDRIRHHLRTGGYNQNELARAIHLHPKVLSRKLHANANAQLTHREVRDILLTLIGWHIIATREEVLHLLAIAEVDAGIFREEEWRTPPLSQLAHSTSAFPLFRESVAITRHNLLALNTRLIGRAWAMERLQHLLRSREPRLITLVGAGGSGKTLLALHVAREMINVFSQGVWFVPLAGVSDPELVPLSILQALNIKSSLDLSPQQKLIAYLREKHLLLVLDNFEHLGAARPIIDQMLGAAARLKVLVTSRVVQRLYGEHEFRVPPLDVPDLKMQVDPAELAQYGAIQLFLERAQAIEPDFILTDKNASLIAQICARVDGLPLALELAAARIKVLAPEALLTRLSQARLSVLTGGARNLPDRQQTLRKTIDWSYNLLTLVEQAWFRRLAIFAGSWELEAVEAMMWELSIESEGQRAELDPVDLLEQLVDNSLVIRLPTEHGQVRFMMLSTLREYALEQLTLQQELAWLHDWHAGYYLRKAEQAESGLRGPQQLTYLAHLAAEHDNFRTSMEWLLYRARKGEKIHSFGVQETDGVHRETADQQISSRYISLSAYECCLRLAAALRHYWEWQGYMSEGRHWLNAVLAVPIPGETGATVQAARAKALSEVSRLVFFQNEQGQALKLIEESLLIWRKLDDPVGLAAALLHRGWVAHGMGEYEEAKHFYREGMDLLLPEKDTWLYAQLLLQLGAATGFTSDFTQTHFCYERSRELFESIGDKSSVADVWKDQGAILLLESRWTEAIDSLLKGIQLCYELGQKQFLATALGSLSFAFGLREEPDPETASLHSATIKGAADNLMETIGLTPWTRSNPFVQMVRQHIRSRVDEQSWTAAWQTGYALSLEQAIELAYRLGKG